MCKFYGSALKVFNSLKSTKGINMLGSPNTYYSSCVFVSFETASSEQNDFASLAICKL